MATTTPIDVPALTWSRAAANRRKTWILAALTILALAPFVIGVSYMFASTVFVRFTSDSITARVEVSREEKTLQSATDMDAETRRDWEKIIERKRAAIDDHSAMGRFKIYEVVILLSLLQAAGLGLLFWSIASAPTAKLLVDAGAVPAGPGEYGARQILEKVASTAGLPPPKLYITESGVPNAFAAGASAQESVLAVSRGLLNLLNSEELEGVFAHEISHIGNEDIRLNTVVAAVGLFLRIPYLLFRRELQAGRRIDVKRRRSPWRVALSPVGLYIVFVAPVLSAAIRAAVARSREFLADSDAIELTGSPRGLVCALAKIGGSGSVQRGSNPAFAHYYFASPSVGRDWFGGNMIASHPPIADRVQRLVTLPGAPAIGMIKEAIEEGRRYTREHPAPDTATVMSNVQDELASFNRGNPMGRVFRLLSSQPVPIYELSSTQSTVLTRIRPGELIVVFDDPGKMRQVNTARQNFGYIERSVKLAAIEGMIPAEVYDPEARAAAEAKLPPLEAMLARSAKTKIAPQKLSANQILAATALAVAVFAGTFLVLMKFAR